MLFKTHMMSCKRLIKIVKCNLMLFDQAPLNLQATMKFPQVKWVWKYVMKQLLNKMVT
jgi:hypothetical protein